MITKVSERPLIGPSNVNFEPGGTFIAPVSYHLAASFARAAAVCFRLDAPES